MFLIFLFSFLPSPMNAKEFESKIQNKSKYVRYTLFILVSLTQLDV